MNTILLSALIMSGLGGAFAFVLAVADKVLFVDEDPRVHSVSEMLPGVNCGACGFASCHAFAEALVSGAAEPNNCRAGGELLASELSEFLGVEVGDTKKQVAVVHCGAKDVDRVKKGIYSGVESCQAAALLGGGYIACPFGCLGFGDCFEACPFGAIKMVDGLPIITPSKCTSCGKCVAACPKKLIKIKPFDSIKGVTAVLCSSKLAMKDVKAVCSVGCIGCGICAKLSQNKMFSLSYATISIS